MSQSPKVSVLMAVFNGESYLSAAIDSILQQTFADFEFLIVNDGSTDSTNRLLSDFAKKDDRIRIISNPTNIGLARSLNSGISAARGDYIARMDADDVALTQRLATQVRFMDENPSVGLLSGNCHIIDSRGQVLGPPLLSRTLYHCDVFWYLCMENPIVHPSVIFRTDIVRRLGGYSESFKHYAEDYRLWFRFFCESRVHVSADPVLHLRKHTTNVTVADQQDHVDEALGVALHSIQQACAPSATMSQLKAIRLVSGAASDMNGILRQAGDLICGLFNAQKPRLSASSLCAIRRDCTHRLIAMVSRYWNVSRFERFALLGRAFKVSPVDAIRLISIRLVLCILVGRQCRV
jgi:glycosyltransferase involved in cell wall biosynthesis